MSTNIDQLLALAEKRMRDSRDPLHNWAHIERVLMSCKQIAEKYPLTTEQYHALLLAAAWHDMARTITKRPSFFFMSFIDDTISACMLWFATWRYGLFGSVAGMSTRLILCNSMGTGYFFKKILLRKRNYILLDILKDADTLDMMAVDRLDVIQPFFSQSKLYRFGCRQAVNWLLAKKEMRLKTNEAKKMLSISLQTFLTSIHDENNFIWSTPFLDHVWLKKKIHAAENKLVELEKKYA